MINVSADGYNFPEGRLYNSEAGFCKPILLQGLSDSIRSIHCTNKVVNEMLPIAVLASFNEMQPLLWQAARRGVQLEGPQEVGALSEGWANIVDLVDQVFNTDDIVLAQVLQGDIL